MCPNDIVGSPGKTAADKAERSPSGHGEATSGGGIFTSKQRARDSPAFQYDSDDDVGSVRSSNSSIRSMSVKSDHSYRPSMKAQTRSLESKVEKATPHDGQKLSPINPPSPRASEGIVGLKAHVGEPIARASGSREMDAVNSSLSSHTTPHSTPHSTPQITPQTTPHATHHTATGATSAGPSPSQAGHSTHSPSESKRTVNSSQSHSNQSDRGSGRRLKPIGSTNRLHDSDNESDIGSIVSSKSNLSASNRSIKSSFSKSDWKASIDSKDSGR
jgi:hypothetical protein